MIINHFFLNFFTYNKLIETFIIIILTLIYNLNYILLVLKIKNLLL